MTYSKNKKKINNKKIKRISKNNKQLEKSQRSNSI